MERTERIELTPDELDRERQAAVQEGGERVAEELEQRLLAAVPDLAAVKGIVTYADVSRMLDCGYDQAREWVQSLEVEQIPGPASQTHYYRWQDIVDAVG
jgi:hypothetical protein